MLRDRDCASRRDVALQGLSDDLLDAGYLASGQPALHKEVVDLSDVVNSAAEVCRAQLEAGNFTVVLLLPPQPVMVEVDPLRMSQVLINLLDNAAKYSEPYGMIVASLEELPDEVRLRVV